MSKLRSTDVVAMEACPLAFLLAPLITQKTQALVHVLNPYGLAVIYRSTKKTDREDAAKLAWVVQRLPAEELPLVTIPSEAEQELRSLTAEQVSLTQSRTREINRFHALFVQAGNTTVTKADLAGAEPRKELCQTLEGSLKAMAIRLERIIEVYEANLAEVEALLKKQVAAHELVPYLLSLPGVGPHLAAAFLGFIGDGSRFRLDSIASYAGLVPRVDCSGDTVRYGPITKRGCPLLRRALIQSAWTLARSSQGGRLKAKYLSWKESKGYGKAITALARKLLETLWILATRKALYLDADPISYQKKLDRYVNSVSLAAGVA